MEDLVKASENYIRFEHRQTGRSIQWPKPKLRAVHKRASILLSRIETPEFLHSAIKGHSYITNATEHTTAHPSVKVDIKKFFQSVRAAAVFHFFKDTMKCKEDVAGILTVLLTVDGHLPTGSSVSPILSYFAYCDMFDKIQKLALARGCTMTCYVDDMTFTGPGASRLLQYEVRRIISEYRLIAHKTKRFKAGQPKVVTGVALTDRGKRLPNRRQKAIANDTSAYKAAGSDEERLKIGRRLMSRLYEAANVDPAWMQRAEEMRRACARLQRSIEIAALENARKVMPSVNINAY